MSVTEEIGLLLFRVVEEVRSVFVPDTSFRLIGVAQQTVWQGAASSTKRKRIDRITTKKKDNKMKGNMNNNNQMRMQNMREVEMVSHTRSNLEFKPILGSNLGLAW